MSSCRTTGAEPPPLASIHARTMESTIRSTASRHVPKNSSDAADSTNVLPSLPRVRAGSIGSTLNAAKHVVSAAAASLRPPCTTGDGGGGAVRESRRERGVRVGARARSGGGRRFVVDDDDGGGEAAAEARRSVLRGGRETDAVRLGERGVVEERRGLCTAGEVLVLVLVPPVVSLLALGVSTDTTYGPVGEVGISTLLRKE